ncbi:MAG TPA: right-handed parallel beta-helix repeat-containing protein [Solirubrobacterales bacterium]|nr:right-handed parallel beta-helix repeat-containing protein [Solirubrobacterales bacterium]
MKTAAKLLSLGLTVGVLATTATVPASAADTYLDCSAAIDGDGSPAQPRNSLGSAFDLGPGDSLLLKRGTTCHGRLEVTGGGSEIQRARVGAYGSGELPQLNGTGRDAVLLVDTSNLTVGDLDISNPGTGGPIGEGDQIRNGVRVIAQAGTVSDLTIGGLEIHDVDGDLTKTPEGSAAIQISATGAAPVRFTGLHITGNQITSVSRSAISISGSNDLDRPEASQAWPEASSGVVIKDNRIDQVAGDGIVTRGTDGALIEGNVVSHGNLAGRPLLDPEGPMCNAGIWAFRANNTVIRGNEVFGMEHNGCDGTGFDVDYRQDGTVIEGNYSHDNEGGFVLLCTDTATHRADVRFNLSVDDGTMINHGPCGIADGILGDLSGIRMFNNTVVGDSPTTSIQLAVSDEMYQPGRFLFRNNLVYARQPAGQIACGNDCTHNAFFNLPPSGTHAVTADPQLIAGYRLGPKSPLRGAGMPITGGATTDYFGNPVPATPSIGFDQAPASRPAQPTPACRKARKARDRTIERAADLNRKLRKLRSKHAPRRQTRSVASRLGKARGEVKRLTRVARRACRPKGGAS